MIKGLAGSGWSLVARLSQIRELHLTLSNSDTDDILAMARNMKHLSALVCKWCRLQPWALGVLQLCPLTLLDFQSIPPGWVFLGPQPCPPDYLNSYMYTAS